MISKMVTTNRDYVQHAPNKIWWKFVWQCLFCSEINYIENRIHREKTVVTMGDVGFAKKKRVDE